MYLIVVYRLQPAAPFVVRCICMAVVPGPMHAVASWCCRTSHVAKMGRPAAAHAAWPQRRGVGMSLVTGRPRDLARVRKASSARPRRVQYSFLRMSIYSFLLQHDRCCRRRHQRHGRIQERPGPEMYTVSCATSSLLPLLRAPSSHRVGFGRFSPRTTWRPAPRLRAQVDLYSEQPNPRHVEPHSLGARRDHLRPRLRKR